MAGVFIRPKQNWRTTGVLSNPLPNDTVVRAKIAFRTITGTTAVVSVWICSAYPFTFPRTTIWVLVIRKA
jgi:hypothetical protein